MAISFKPYYKSDNPIGSGTYKFREYSVEKLPRSFISLEVKKITSNTSDGTNTFENESFILLDIYPFKIGDVVNVEYGGLTKTLTFDGINAQQVFFGTFKGATDEITTPASGTLIIRGDCKAFGSGFSIVAPNEKDGLGVYGGAITAVNEMRGITEIPADAFASGATTINYYHMPALIDSITIPSTVTYIAEYAMSTDNYSANGPGPHYVAIEFEADSSLTEIAHDAIAAKNLTLPSSVKKLGYRAFYLSSNYSTVPQILGDTPPVLDKETVTVNSGGITTTKTNYDNFVNATSIIVPKGSLNAYQNETSWRASGYANKVVEAEE